MQNFAMPTTFDSSSEVEGMAGLRARCLSAPNAGRVCLRQMQPTMSSYRPRVMIIDDEPVNIKVVQKYLKLAGYRNFLTTTDPRPAMEMIASEAARRSPAGRDDAER